MQKLLPNPILQLLNAALITVAAIFLALHFVDLTADFPNHSRWMDWSKYTDEGWYGDAAIRHFQLGHWYLPGDFNPASALPVWPFLEALVFHFTGVSLVAARALTVCVFAGILLCSWLLLRRWSPDRSETLAPSVAIFLLALSPFCFVFTRLAILEPLLVLLTLLALLAAGKAATHPRYTTLTLGLLIPAMILTKTTALFLVPSLMWLLFAALGYRVRAFLRLAIPASFLAVVLWLLWFTFIVRHGYLLDYRYLFSANGYTGITLANAVTVLQNTAKDGSWIGTLLFPAALVAIAFALISFNSLRRYPLILSLILWAAGYTAFLSYHNNLQPRYYLVVAVPLTLLLPLILELFLTRRLFPGPRTPFARGLCSFGAAVLIAAIALPDARETLHFLRRPQHTLLSAARQLTQYIADYGRQDPTHSPLVLSISGSDLSLMTGLHSINDDFGTLELANRVATYRPGWYAAWNQIDDDKMDALTPLYRVQRVAAFPAMDDPDRNLLILYRLDPAEPSISPRRHVRPVPRPLQTKVGQQPSTSQLVH